MTGPAYMGPAEPASRMASESDGNAATSDDLSELPSCDTIVPDLDAGPDAVTWCHDEADTAKELDERQGQGTTLNSVWEWTSAIQPWCNNEVPERQWAGDRHYQCMWRKDIAQLIYTNNGSKAGEVWYTTEHELRTKWNSNMWKGRSAIHIIGAFGVATGATYGGEVTCVSSGDCQLGGTTGTHSIPMITRDHLMDYTLRDDDFSGQNPFTGSVNNSSFARFKFVHPTGNPGVTWSPKTRFPSVRCDNLLNENTGCVVSGAEPILDLSTRSKAEAHAVHVRNAQMSGLPGAPNGSPLTRASSTQAQANRNNTCNRVKAKRPDGIDCDEYPFAVTAEGGSTTGVRTWQGSEVPLSGIPALNPANPQYLGSPGMSMAYISSSANRSGGGILTWFFRKNRVMEGETFYVKGKS